MNFKKALEKELNNLYGQAKNARFVELKTINRKIDLVKELMECY